MNKGELIGQVAIVTGGGRGLGQATTQSLAEAGTVVVVAAECNSFICGADFPVCPNPKAPLTG